MSFGPGTYRIKSKIDVSDLTVKLYIMFSETAGGRLHSIKENAEALVVASKETRLEVNADKSKYMAISQDQKAGQSHNIKNDNSSFERVEDFKYLGTALTNQNSICGGGIHSEADGLCFEVYLSSNLLQ